MKQRSASYPYYSISDSLGFCEKIYSNYGKGYRATRELIADALGYSVGSLAQKIGTAVQYGFLDVKAKEGYKVTDLFVRWARPISNEAKEEALLEAFKSPNLYRELIGTFEGEILPPVKPLANILLQNHSISEKACDRAAEIFLQNLELVDGLTNDGRLVLESKGNDAVVEEYEQEVIEEQEESPRKYDLLSPTKKEKSHQYQEPKTKDDGSNGFGGGKPIPHNIPLKGKFPAQLLLPSDVSSADFDFIISYIGLIRNQY